MSHIPFFPEQASTLASNVDDLYFAWIALSAIVTLAIVVLVIRFAIRYRAGSTADRTVATGEKHEHNLRMIEFTWMGVPLFLFLLMFAWSTFAFYDNSSVPPNALPIYVVGKQWMWHLEHPGGQREINELHVPMGQPIELVLASQDVIHSFSIPGFRVKQDVVPGRYTHLWFQATKPGEYRWFCTQFCGTSHSHMVGRVVVMSAPDYEAWLARAPAPGSMEAEGASRFRELGCGGCHEPDPSAPNAGTRAPALGGLYGREVKLRDGRTLVADERFLHDEILIPNLQVPAGYEATMPSYRGQVDEEQVLEIVAYLKSLRDKPAGEAP